MSNEDYRVKVECIGITTGGSLEFNLILDEDQTNKLLEALNDITKANVK